MNANTPEFQDGDEVAITAGKYKGYTGIIIEAMPTEHVYVIAAMPPKVNFQVAGLILAARPTTVYIHPDNLKLVTQAEEF